MHRDVIGVRSCTFINACGCNRIHCRCEDLLLMHCYIFYFTFAGRKPGGTNYGEKYKLHSCRQHYSVNMFLVVEHEIVCSISTNYPYIAVVLTFSFYTF